MRLHMSLLSLCAACLLLIPWAPVHAEREVEELEQKEYQLDRGGTVRISIDDGYVHITTWDRDKALVKMTKHARGDSRGEARNRLAEIDVIVEQHGDRLTIREKHEPSRDYSFFDLLDPDRWDEFGGRVSWVDFDLTIPRKTDLDISTDKGDVAVSDLLGNVDIKTDEGDVELRQIRSDNLFVRTDEGDVILEEIGPGQKSDSSRLEIHTDEGEIELSGIEMGRLRIESDEGDAFIKKIRCNHLDYRSDEGNIELSFEIPPYGDYRCRTDEGEILLFLPGDSSFRITASSQEGRIRSDFPITVREMSEGERADDIVGQGGADLYLFSDEGDIQLRRK